VKAKFLLNCTALAALAFLAPGQVKAQDAYRGKFTLPFEAHWGAATLPAGEYTITLHDAVAPYLLRVRGEGKTALVWAGVVADQPVGDDSALTITNTGAGQAVTRLRAAELGLTFSYAVPKTLATPAAVMKTVARVSVLVRAAGKPVTTR
jgi:hypothetical protein